MYFSFVEIGLKIPSTYMPCSYHNLVTNQVDFFVDQDTRYLNSDAGYPQILDRTIFDDLPAF